MTTPRAPFHDPAIQVPSTGAFGIDAVGVAGSNLYGVGTPEANVRASVGTEYRDVTPGTPSIWLKTSGDNTTTGWEQISGGGGGGSLVDVPISTVEADWSNTAGAWVFNGDGTVTSTAVADVMTLPLPDSAVSAIVWSYLKLAATLQTDAGVTLAVASEFGQADAGVGSFDGFGASFLWFDTPTIGGSNAGWGPTALAGSLTTTEMLLVGMAVLGLVNDAAVVAGSFEGSYDNHFATISLTLLNNGVPGSVVDLSACELQVAPIP